MASALKDDASKRPWLPFKSDRQPIPDDLARELGALVIEWSGFESALLADIRVLAKSPVVKKLFSDEPRSFKKRIELWKDAIRALYPNDAGYIEVANIICSGSKDVARYRHVLVHNRWLEPEKAGEPYRLLLDKPLEKHPAGHALPVPVEMVRAIHQRLRQSQDLLWGFTLNRMIHRTLRPKSAGGGPKA
jgi:hypothetical protein